LREGRKSANIHANRRFIWGSRLSGFTLNRIVCGRAGKLQAKCLIWLSSIPSEGRLPDGI
jgi:hypothetical protein